MVQDVLQAAKRLKEALLLKEAVCPKQVWNMANRAGIQDNKSNDKAKCKTL